MAVVKETCKGSSGKVAGTVDSQVLLDVGRAGTAVRRWMWFPGAQTRLSNCTNRQSVKCAWVLREQAEAAFLRNNQCDLCFVTRQACDLYVLRCFRCHRKRQPDRLANEIAERLEATNSEIIAAGKAIGAKGSEPRSARPEISNLTTNTTTIKTTK